MIRRPSGSHSEPFRIHSGHGFVGLYEKMSALETWLYLA